MIDFWKINAFGESSENCNSKLTKSLKIDSSENIKGLNSQEASQQKKNNEKNNLPIQKKVHFTKENIFHWLFNFLTLFTAGIFVSLFFKFREMYSFLIIAVFLFIELCFLVFFRNKYTISSKKYYGLKINIPNKSIVVRDEKETIINTQDIVEGDILVLKRDIQVGADCRVIQIQKKDNFPTRGLVISNSLTSKIRLSNLLCTEPVNQLQSMNYIPQGSAIIAGKAKAIAICSATTSRLWRCFERQQVQEKRRMKKKVNLGLNYQVILFGIIQAIISIFAAILFSFLESLLKKRTQTESLMIGATTLIAYFPTGILITCQCALNYLIKKQGQGYKLPQNIFLLLALANSIYNENQQNPMCIVGDLSYLLNLKQLKLKSIWINLSEVQMDQNSQTLDQKRNGYRCICKTFQHFYYCFQATTSEATSAYDYILKKYFQKISFNLNPIVKKLLFVAKSEDGSDMSVTADSLNFDFTIRIVEEKTEVGRFVAYLRGETQTVWNVCKYIEIDGQILKINQRIQKKFDRVMRNAQNQGRIVSAFARLDLHQIPEKNFFDQNGNLQISLNGFTFLAFALFEVSSNQNASNVFDKMSSISTDLVLFTKLSSNTAKQVAKEMGLIFINNEDEVNMSQYEHNSFVISMNCSNSNNKMKQFENKSTIDNQKSINCYNLEVVNQCITIPIFNHQKQQIDKDNINTKHEVIYDQLAFNTPWQQKVTIIANADIFLRERVVANLISNGQHVWYIAGSIQEEKAFWKADVILTAPYEKPDMNQHLFSYHKSTIQEQISKHQKYFENKQINKDKYIQILKNAGHIQLHFDEVSEYPTYIHSALNSIQRIACIQQSLRRVIYYILPTYTASIFPLIMYISFGFPLAIPPLLMILISGPISFFPALSLVVQSQIDEGLTFLNLKTLQSKIETIKAILYSFFVIGIMMTCAGMLSFFTAMNLYGIPPSSLFGIVNIQAYPVPNLSMTPPPYPIKQNTPITADMPYYNQSLMKHLNNCTEDTQNVTPNYINWVGNNEFNFDLRASLVYCDLKDNKWKTAISWSYCKINQHSSSITEESVCYSTEALHYAQTAYFLGLTIFQAFNVFSSKQLAFSIYFTSLNSYIFLAIFCQLIIAIAIVVIPYIQESLGTRSVPFYLWGIPAIPVTIFSQCHELIRQSLTQKISFIRKFLPN